MAEDECYDKYAIWYFYQTVNMIRAFYADEGRQNAKNWLWMDCYKKNKKGPTSNKIKKPEFWKLSEIDVQQMDNGWIDRTEWFLIIKE